LIEEGEIVLTNKDYQGSEQKIYGNPYDNEKARIAYLRYAYCSGQVILATAFWAF